MIYFNKYIIYSQSYVAYNDMNLVMNISIIDFSILPMRRIYHLLPLWFENIFQCDCLVRLFKIIQSYGCFLLNVVNKFIDDIILQQICMLRIHLIYVYKFILSGHTSCVNMLNN